MKNKQFKVILVCGARPNFMKIAPIIRVMNKSNHLRPFLVHTGQHYDEDMSKSFFKLLGIPMPDINLEVGSGSHAEQTARIIERFEKVCLNEKPDMVVVVGDVNSTLACTITAKKLWIPTAHVEAGLRSGDMRMPEEINRIVTDSISDLLFTTEPDGGKNLLISGTKPSQIHFAGNVMIDTLLQNLSKAKSNPILSDLKIESKSYCLLTMHRPSNVDNEEILTGLFNAFEYIQKKIKIIFPAHPRSIKMIKNFGLYEKLTNMKNILVCDPLNYHQTQNLSINSRFVITDSGGLQEETTALGIPCITIRENTERPVTVSVGTNEVVGTDPETIKDAVNRVLSDHWKKGGIPDGWDGKASERIVKSIELFLHPAVVLQE